MKKLLLLSVVCYLSFVPCSLLFAEGNTDKQQDKTFTWSLALQNVGKDEAVSFSAPVKSVTGDKYRIIINSEADCYCYVIAETADDDVVVLHAGSLKGGAAWISPEIVLSLPNGSENFFIVACREEPPDLVRAVASYQGSTGPTQRRALMNEVFRLRSAVSQFREIPEKPVLMGGASRGESGKNEGVEFSGMDTYVKTISIEH